MVKRRNRFSQLFNVHFVNDVRQTEIHTEEPIVPQPNSFEVQMAIGKLKRNKSSGINTIPAKVIEAGVRTIHSEIHNIINSIWNTEKLPEGWNESIIVPIY